MDSCIVLLSLVSVSLIMSNKYKTKQLGLGIKARIEGEEVHIISGGSEYINIKSGETICPEHNVIHKPRLRKQAISWARRIIL